MKVNRHGQFVTADVTTSEIADAGLTHHRIVALSADTVRRCSGQIHGGLAIATKL